MNSIVRDFPKRRVISHGIDQIWTADLLEMRKYSKRNKGVKYLLLVIHVFSKFAWVEMLKSENGLTDVKALHKHLEFARSKTQNVVD